VANSARPLTWRDIRGTVRRHADELLSTAAEAAALEALRVATRETGGDMERHTMRQYLIAERIADTRGIPYDRELLLCACFLHDSGLYRPASTGDVYIKDSARYRIGPSSRSTGRTSGCGCVGTPVSSTTPSPHGGGWPRKSNSSAAPTSWRCIRSSGGSASRGPGSSASSGGRFRAPGSGPRPSKSHERTGGGCCRACSGPRDRGSRSLEPAPRARGMTRGRPIGAWQETG